MNDPKIIYNSSWNDAHTVEEIEEEKLLMTAIKNENKSFQKKFNTELNKWLRKSIGEFPKINLMNEVYETLMTEKLVKI